MKQLDQSSFPRLWTLFQKLFGDQSVKLEAAKEMISECDLIVDFGCATGFMFPLYSSTFGCSYLGLDIDENALAVAKENFPTATFSSANLLDFNEYLEQYSSPVIIFSNVFHHMNDPDIRKLFWVLEQLPRHVRLIALDPEAKRRSYSIVFRSFHRLEKGDFRRSITEILNLCTENGLTVTKAYEFLGRAPIWPFGPTVQAWGLEFQADAARLSK